MTWRSERRFYPALESLRGICALMIVILHAPWTWHLQNSPIVANSWLAVDFFFVLSGFVIAGVHGQAQASAAEAGRFLIRRAFRLYPLHLVTLAAMLALVSMRGAYLGSPDISPPLLVAANAAAVQGWGFTDSLILNWPSWSVSTEIAAYLLFAGICLAVRSIPRRVAVMAAISALSLAVLIALGTGTLNCPLSLRLLRCLYGFGLGVAVWHVARGQPHLRDAGAYWLAGALAVTMALFAIASIPAASLAVPLIFAGIVYVAARDRRSVAKRLLERQPLRRLGELSFSIYMVHLPVLSVIGAVAAALIPAREAGKIGLNLWAGDALLAAAVVAVIALSGLTYRFIESPGRERGRAVASNLADEQGEAAPEVPAREFRER